MINSGLFSSKTNEWATPLALFQELDQEFGFTLDPCATPQNAKCKKFYTIEDDGLKQNWGGHRVFCNPPYGREIGRWVEKCYREAQKGALVVALIPARTDTRYFHEFIWKKAKEIRFLRGRLHFNESKQAAPFPSMIVIWK